MSPPQSVTILGAGLTGLTTAYHLLHRLPPSTRITIIDAASRLGGWVDSASHPIGFKGGNGEMVEGEVVLESGPRSIRPRGSKGAAGMLRLIRELGLESDIIPIPKTHPSAKNRYLLDLSDPYPSLTPLTLNPFKPKPPILSGILPQLLLEPFSARNHPPCSGVMSGTGEKVSFFNPQNELETEQDESVDSFLQRRFGPETARLASAMMHGIYAASSTSLSARAIMGSVYEGERRYGSVILGLLRRGLEGGVKREKRRLEEEWKELGELGKIREGWSMYGLKSGIGGLTRRLGEEVAKRGEVRMGERVLGVRAVEDGVEIETTKGTTHTHHLISTLPPSSLSTLLPFPELNPLLNPSTSVGVLSLVYPLPPSQIHPEGFGYLIPRPPLRDRSALSNPAGVLGVVFDSTALPGLDDTSVEGKVTKLTVMMGGPYWSTYPSSTRLGIPSSPEELVAPALNHLETIFPILKTTTPLLVLPRIHKDCIPTYIPGHNLRLSRLHSRIQKSDLWSGKLSLAGNGFGGVGVNDCVFSAGEVVKGLERGVGVTGMERWA